MLPIYEDLYGDNSTDVAGTYCGMADVYDRQDQYADALGYYKMYLAMRFAELGEYRVIPKQL